MNTDSTLLCSENLQLNIKNVKKRGRKPKLKLEEVEKKPKKRGRKPKENVEKKNGKKRGRKPNILNTEINSNLIKETNLKDNVLYLPISSNKIKNNILSDIYQYSPDINNPNPYDSSQHTIFKSGNYILENKKKSSKKLEDINFSQKIFKEKIDFNKEINKLEKDYCKNTFKKNKIKPLLVYYNEYNKKQEWPKSSNLRCFWCFHNFDCIPCALPYKYQNNNYHVFGNFCSKECAAAYNFDLNDNNIWERYSLLNMLYSEIEENNTKVKIAPSRLTLNDFGGHLSIEEFRESKNVDYKILYPPMISIIPIVEEIKSDRLLRGKSYYRPIDSDRIKNNNHDL